MAEDYDVEIGLDEGIAIAANRYYSESKKYKKKIDGVKIAIELMKTKLKTAEKIKVKTTEVIEKREKKWFEKYRFGFTRNGLLVLAGRDATSNEIIVKKHMDSNDLHFHTNIIGASHVVLKNGKNAVKEDFEDAGLIAAIYSKAWNEGFGSVDVFYVKPDQVSKTAQSGEFLSTGAFVIRGERNWLKKISLEFCVGIVNLKVFDQGDEEIVMVGSADVFKKVKSPYYITLSPGNKIKSDICNAVLKEIKLKGYKQFDINDLLHILPAGKYAIKKN